MLCCTVYTEMCANPTLWCNTGDEAVGGPPAEGSGEVVVEPPPEQAEDTPALGSGAAVVVPPLSNEDEPPGVGSGAVVEVPPPEEDEGDDTTEPMGQGDESEVESEVNQFGES